MKRLITVADVLNGVAHTYEDSIESAPTGIV